MNTWQRAPVRRNVVQKQLKVAHDDELAHPAALDRAQLGHLDVALVRRPNASGRIDPQRALRLVRRHRTLGGHLLAADHVAREPAQLAHDTLPRQANHQRGAVVALGGTRERAHQKLVNLLLRHHHAVHALEDLEGRTIISQENGLL